MKKMARWGAGKAGGISAAIVLFAAALVASSPRALATSQPGVSAASDAGQRGNDASPNRIISLIPAVTEMLFAIGAGDAVVGVSSFDRFPAEVRTRANVGGLIDPDFERILSLRPDLVIVYGTQGDLISRLQRARIPMYNYEHAGLADVTQTLRKIGERIGRKTEGDRLAATIERQLSEVRTQAARLPRPKTMMVFEREPGTLRGMYASGGIGFLHEMLVIAGGDNVCKDVARQSLQVTAEQVLARAPEVIVEMHSGPQWTPAIVTREQNVWNALSAVPAVRNRRVHILVDEMMAIPGPRVIDATRALAKVLHPGRMQ